MRYDVCILSRDRLYAQWILLVLSQRGCAVTVSESHLTAPSSSLYLTDLDSAEPPKKEGARVICFSRDMETVSRHGGLLRPFSDEELFLALDGARTESSTQEDEVSRDGERTVKFDGRYIHLTQREYELYEMLLRAGTQGVSRAEICRQIWGCEETESLNIYIHYLRKKLEANGKKVIKSHRGKGYSLITRGN